jgi:LPS export ABC transporter permease LptG
MSLAPFVFALFGSALALRMRRGSRGFGVLVSLAILVAYYLLTLAGDQAARAGTVPPVVGGWLATASILLVGLLTLLWRDRHFSWSFSRRRAPAAAPAAAVEQRAAASPVRRFRLSIANFPTLLDIGVVRTMLFSFIFGFTALVLIFDVFTTFELWKFISAHRATTRTVAEYLFYLLPLISVELFPGSVLVAALMTYALIAKRREAIAWWSSGQSVYRLMVPGFVFAMVVASGCWLIQERIMPQSNVRQDALRARIRGSIAQMSAGADRRWLVSADGARIYAYDFDDRRQVLLKPSIYEFDNEQIQLRRVINGEEGKWLAGNQFEVSKAQWISLDQPKVVREAADQLQIAGVDSPATFRPTVDRPSQLDSVGLRNYIAALKVRGAETTALAVALQRKYSSPFTILVMALIGMPLAIEFGRKSTVIALCSAVVVSLAFWLISSGFQQLGEHSLLPPPAAVWTPIVMFACGGLYFISRVRT